MIEIRCRTNIDGKNVVVRAIRVDGQFVWEVIIKGGVEDENTVFVPFEDLYGDWKQYFK